MIYTNFTRPEGARRNLLTYSEQFDNASWGKTSGTVVDANAAIDPKGFITAEKLSVGTSSVPQISKFVTASVAQTNTGSIYCKADEIGFVLVRIRDATNTTKFLRTILNLSDGTLSGTATGANGTIGNLVVENAGDGWWRLGITGIVNAIGSSTSIQIVLDLVKDAAGNIANLVNSAGTDGIFIWGAQLEVGGLTAYQPVVSGLEFNTEPLNHARIGYQNLTYGLTPTFSTAAAGFPAIAATYPTTFEYWKPTALPAAWGVDFGSAKAVDYCGIVGDLNGATIEIQSSSNFSTWTTRGTIGPTTDRINMALFLEASVRYWRLIVTNGIPNIAVVYLGKALAMQRKIYQGHTPLNLSRTTELSNNMSDGGQYLGRSVIRKGAQTSCDWSHLTADWYRANFDPFVKAARTAPFFIGWRPEQYPNELGYVWTDGDIAPQNSGPKNYMSVSVSFMGLINE